MRTRALFAIIALLIYPICAQAAETLPPKPAGYFNDYAGAVSKDAALRFNEQLAQFERDTSNQVLVAVYSKMQSDSDIADYTYRVKETWKVGQTGKNNGAVLFVFIQDRKMFIQVNYGLEGVLPDVTCFDITERHIKPRFRANDYEGGLSTGINLICKAIRGEYKGEGKTVNESAAQKSSGKFPFVLFIIFIIVLIIISRSSRGRRRGWGYSSAGGPFIGGWGGGGGGWSGGSSSGGGFSGFTGGGGMGGGGGAGSSW